MSSLVTGATGFVGAAVARALLAAGDSVRILARPGGPQGNIQGLPIEVASGDLLDRRSLERALKGCTTLYHVAACYKLWTRDPQELYRTNVEGTRAILEAAGEAGVDRIVYTSTVGVLPTSRDGRPVNEQAQATLAGMVGHYKRSKFLAEQEALRLARAGLPVVIVNPSAPVGPRDIKPTPTGQMIVDYLNGRMFGYLETGLNVVAVEDVAHGHLLAGTKGRVGERYILGHANLRLSVIFRLLEEITGIPAPRRRVPYALAYGAACASEAWARIRGGAPRIPRDGVRMARKYMFFDTSKAVAELGLPQTPVEEALRRAVRWFTEHGYVGKKRSAPAWTASAS
ncbi:MAG: NAD-dependent epimerase/dehydratase family protein [Deltaproteobacteria bacterium]|nr:NAD-dependent epimerase/dehydratase family protein [Deltaproteobacteria bacterium]MBI3078481.1 NAD-dependent epimerase/dehydratase family protein [Deltaproteobacteria bacterium]